MTWNLIKILDREHRIILCTYSLDEVSRVIKEKFPHKLPEWDQLLTDIEFELIYTPEDLSRFKVPYIRDPDDSPILISAMIANPDMVVTGDKDFFTKEIQKHLAVYSPSDFLRNFT